MSPVNDLVYNRTLDVLNARLGTSLPSLASFDTRDTVIASAVLPEIAKVARDLEDTWGRHDAYARFHTPLAYPYFADVLAWLEAETHSQSQATLTQIVALLVKARDAQRVWELCRRMSKRPFYYVLLSKLATFKSVAAEVKDAIVAALEADVIPDWELQYVAKVRDPRIDEWFERQTSAMAARYQAIGRRRTSKKQPQGIIRSPSVPDRKLELTSAEVNLEEAPEFLTKFARQFGIIVPESLSALDFLESAPLDRWLATTAETVSGSRVTIWFRLEDVDAVELVITGEDVHILGKSEIQGLRA
jgi:hypothetical protein